MSLVFISYAAEDAAVLLHLIPDLEDAGYATWSYERDSVPGPSYLDQIVQALAHAQVVVVVVSPAALASGQVDKEVVQAHERAVPFLPLLHGVTHEQLCAPPSPCWRPAVSPCT